MPDVYDEYLTKHFSQVAAPLEIITEDSYPELQKYLPQDKNAMILDFGCGMGHFLLFLKLKGYTNFQGVDISKEQVDFVRQHITDKVTLVEDLADSMGFLTRHRDTFDLIVMNDVIEHIPKGKIVELLKSVHGSLKREGTLIVSTNNLVTLGGLFTRFSDFTHEIGFTEISLAQVLRYAGFGKIKFLDENPRLRLKARSIVGFFVKHAYRLFLKTCYYIEKPGTPRPKILSTSLVSVAWKSDSKSV